jgi:uncharacterized membrane protein YuzA (DUF378 family)
LSDVNRLDWATFVLVVFGAVNWGLVGLGEFAGENLNLVNLLLGNLAGGQVEAALYLLVGLAGLYQVYFGYELHEAH